MGKFKRHSIFSEVYKKAFFINKSRRKLHARRFCLEFETKHRAIRTHGALAKENSRGSVHLHVSVRKK
jgi:hypothetical protein